MKSETKMFSLLIYVFLLSLRLNTADGMNKDMNKFDFLIIDSKNDENRYLDNIISNKYTESFYTIKEACKTKDFVERTNESPSKSKIDAIKAYKNMLVMINRNQNLLYSNSKDFKLLNFKCPYYSKLILKPFIRIGKICKIFFLSNTCIIQWVCANTYELKIIKESLLYVYVYKPRTYGLPDKNSSHLDFNEIQFSSEKPKSIENIFYKYTHLINCLFRSFLSLFNKPTNELSIYDVYNLYIVVFITAVMIFNIHVNKNK